MCSVMLKFCSAECDKVAMQLIPYESNAEVSVVTDRMVLQM